MEQMPQTNFGLSLLLANVCNWQPVASRMVRLTVLLAMVVLVIDVQINRAQATSTSWRCEFSNLTEPMVYIAELGSGKGKIVGSQGTGDVWVIEGSAAITFLEPLLTGAVQVTTIVLKTGEAAHSRNTVLSLNGDSFMPSQARGTCKLW